MSKRTGKTIDCVCDYELVDEEATFRITYCPLHGAAPDLLEALKTLVNGGEASDRAHRLGIHIDCVIAARAAIAKAEGKEARR